MEYGSFHNNALLFYSKLFTSRYRYKGEVVALEDVVNYLGRGYNEGFVMRSVRP